MISTDSQKQIIVVQYLRGLAAVLVVWFHSTVMGAVAPYFPKFPGHFGDFGVNIFFVVSGFVMWSTTDRTSRSTSSFWKARIIRIVPLYWLATTIFVVAAYVLPSALLNERIFDAAHIAKSLLFIPAFNASAGNIGPVYTIGWTLNFEMLFYFVFGLGLLFRTALARAVFVSATLVAIFLLGLFSAPDSVWKFYFNLSLFEFVAGMLLGMMRFLLMKAGLAFGLVLMGCGLGLIVVAQSMDQLYWTLGIGCTSFVAGALPFERVARKHPSSFGRLLGDASYSIYLFHPFFQRALFIAMGSTIASYNEAAWYAACALVVGTLGGVLVYLAIERRLLRLRKAT